jgi:NAD(P)-dependent dehydrogenase (short-subunit alcohol dehydrogenase family)
LIIAKTLALNGAHKVYITGRNAKTLETAAKESPHGNIIPISGDVTSKESLKSIAEKIRSEVGYLNLLVANAGTTGPGPRFAAPADRPPMSVHDFQAAVLEPSVEDWDDCFRVNVTGAWFSVMTNLDLLAAANKTSPYGQRGIKSQVIITSSIAAFNRGAGSGFA